MMWWARARTQRLRRQHGQAQKPPRRPRSPPRRQQAMLPAVPRASAALLKRHPMQMLPLPTPRRARLHRCSAVLPSAATPPPLPLLVAAAAAAAAAALRPPRCRWRLPAAMATAAAARAAAQSAAARCTPPIPPSTALSTALPQDASSLRGWATAARCSRRRRRHCPHRSGGAGSRSNSRGPPLTARRLQRSTVQAPTLQIHSRPPPPTLTPTLTPPW